MLKEVIMRTTKDFVKEGGGVTEKQRTAELEKEQLIQENRELAEITKAMEERLKVVETEKQNRILTPQNQEVAQTSATELSPPQQTLTNVKSLGLGLVDQTTTAISNEYEIGVQYYSKCQYQQAMEYFLKISRNNKHPDYPGACLGLYSIYRWGLGISKNPAQAETYGKIVTNNIAWFKAQAERGTAHAQDNLGYLYKHGIGVVQDPYQAHNWFKKAADQGYALAQCNLSMLYHKYAWAQQHYIIEARSLMEKAANQGHPYAQYNIG